MKFSILLPTRNRLELLRLAIESVRTQDYADWEILISDNASDADISNEMKAFGDCRIKTRRFDELVPVTDNWNAALEMATGDYFIMLGDDDVLLPGALSRLGDIISEWDCPDAVYAQAHQYAYPNVIPGHAEAFFQTGYNEFLEGVRKPFRMTKEVAHRMVKAAMRFWILYGFNMQHFIISTRLVDQLRPKGPFFQSPYPDYYAANAVLFTAESLVATPDPVALIGISPKSFGFYYVNSQETEGAAFLHNLVETGIDAPLRKQLVPGSQMNDCWLFAMETLKRNFPEFKPSVSYSRYRRIQYHAILQSNSSGRYYKLLANMRLWEIVALGFAAAAYILARVLPATYSTAIRDTISHRLFSRSPRFDPKRKVVPYRDILEAARAYAR